MKCSIIIILALATLSNASSLLRGVEREIRVNGDRRIFIRGSNKIVVFNVPEDDPKSLEIVVKDYGIGVGKIIKMDENKKIIKQIDFVPGRGVGGVFADWDSNEKNITGAQSGNAQMKTLINIFKNYEGVSGESTFYQILKQVKQQVEAGVLNSVVYDVVSELEVGQSQTYEPSKDETPLSGEAAKPSDFKDEKRTSPKLDTTDQKAKLNQALQAARQVEWIQSLLETKRNQQVGDARYHLSRQGDLMADANQAAKEDDLKRLVLENSIQELQREIIREQLKAQQLQGQQQLLSSQKQQLKLHKVMGQHQGLQPNQMQDLQDAYQQVKKQEQKLMEAQLNIQKKVRSLQDDLIRKQEQFKEDLKKEFDL